MPRKTGLRTNSRSGMKLTGVEKLLFTSSDVCAIIQSCANHKVKTLKCQGLELDFSQTAETTSTPSGSVRDDSGLAPVAAITEETHDQMTKETIERDELLLREQEIAMSLIENPSLAEELLLDGELEDADDEPEAE